MAEIHSIQYGGEQFGIKHEIIMPKPTPRALEAADRIAGRQWDKTVASKIEIAQIIDEKTGLSELVNSLNTIAEFCEEESSPLGLSIAKTARAILAKHTQT